MVLHDSLHLETQLRGRRTTVSVSQPIDALDGYLPGTFFERREPIARFDKLTATHRGRATKDDQIDQRIGSEAISAVHRDTGRLADRHEPRHNNFFSGSIGADEFPMIVRGDATHVVVHGGNHRNRIRRDVDTGKDLCRLRNARQAFLDDIRTQVLEMQTHMIFLCTDSAPFPNLDGNRSTDDIARRQVLRIGSVAFHETLPLGVGEIAALTPRTLGDQHASPVDSSRMELHELHVL